jgi:hypothetical protein
MKSSNCQLQNTSSSNLQFAIYILYFALLCLSALGCGSGAVKTYPVKGKVMYKGKPMVGGGSLSLQPLTNQEGATAGGTIDKDGNFVLTTYKEGDGSMAGEFRVLVFQKVFNEGAPTKDGEPPSKATADVPPADRIPPAYNNPLESQLKLTVKPEPQENVVLEIK